ncbi:MAG TPA: ATP-binding cassette domain-containing protein [Clostridiaceae bacterium]|nr:ATP-binding cassette domain-containing protein [Clostridiaceae bacterium]
MGLVVDIKKKLKGFTLEVDFETDGDYLGILGASGSGKSMTLKCIAGIETPDEGRILLDGKVLFDSLKKINLKPQDRNIGYLFQSYALFPNMTVEENIGIGLSCSQKEKAQKVSEMIISFYLAGLEKKYPKQLSGGQQQRVALARCIAYRPDVLLLDEPFSALDSHLKDQVQTEVLELLRLYQGEVLMVTHSRDEAYRLCKNLIIIDKGTLALHGDTKEIFEQPRLLAAARLTGCKNISKCEILSSHSVRAADWDVFLKTEKAVADSVKYLGIRAHDFQIAQGDDTRHEDNIIECKFKKIVEDIFEYNVLLENGIVFKVKKEEWDNRQDKENLFLKVPEDAILLLE